MGWKEKEYRKDQKNKTRNQSVSNSEMEKEILRMQGLMICPECITAYSFYKPRCPTCDTANKSVYISKT